jgi:hypothetical protein
MKAQCASLTLYHFVEGHHREVCLWHDQDHKPEVVGTVPGIFISQRWVAPAEIKALFPPSTLEYGGGEYVNLYWTASSPDELGADFAALGNRLESVGRMEPMKYIHRTWGDRFRPVSAIARRGLGISAEAVTCAPQTTGLMVTIDSGVSGAAEDPSKILEMGIFTAAVRLTSDSNDVCLWYTDRPDVLAAYQEYQSQAPPPDARRLHEGIYVPSIGHYQFYT